MNGQIEQRMKIKNENWNRVHCLTICMGQTKGHYLQFNLIN